VTLLKCTSRSYDAARRAEFEAKIATKL